jgi:homoserine O-acetyltransferase/O-succinyltransferase
VAALLGLALGCSQQHAGLGDFTLESGQVIRDCQLGYRTFGTLDAAGSNAVLVTLWSMGRSSQAARQVGAGKLYDSARHFVIVVDPFGNGVSSSPSNSAAQPGPAFPEFTVGDLVEAQHRLLTQVLRIRHLKAVVGVSLGGMQAFQWATAHPEFVDRVVAIAGTPRTTPEEQARWQGWIADMQRSRWQRVSHELGRFSPFGAFSQLRTDSLDYARQAQAIRTLDVSRRHGGRMERAAAAVRAKMLVVVSPTDEVVDGKAPREFVTLVRPPASAELLELAGTCGHSAPSCEKETLWPAVARFLE